MDKDIDEMNNTLNFILSTTIIKIIMTWLTRDYFYACIWIPINIRQIIE